ncbi:BNR-4 repeat-containing protein [Paracoccus hibiscisoli]|uniref:BNR-4 repeat-containing protein n=1 Tax=Paracoccus hibiscisoli TaxID=2023261 RepID=UPI0023F55BC9|nr:BNR-4 repeat-containing protein [Paracoccus hibiscisoli]
MQPHIVKVGFRGPRGVGIPEGQPGQVVGFGPGGAPVAVNLPDGTLPQGAPGQLVGYDTEGNPVAVDAPVGGGPAYDDEALLAQLAEQQARIEQLEQAIAEIVAGGGGPALSAPQFTTLPSLLGSTALGGTVTISLGSASGVPAPTITGTLTLPGASPVTVTDGQQITIAQPDLGGSLSLTAVATNSEGSDTETVSLAVPAIEPAQFSPGDWSVTTGLEPSQVVLNIGTLPFDGGSAITALEYSTGGAWIALTGTGTGPRTLTMAEAGAEYPFQIRAVNAVDPGTASGVKNATSGAIATIAPAFGSGGTVTVDGDDIVFTAPPLTAGTPTPTVTLAATRNGTPITVTAGRYAGGAVPGDADRVYAATWTAANGVPPNATRQANLTVTPTAPTIASVEYFARDGATFPWYQASTPNAVYDATGNKTWIVYERWDGLERRAALRIYDHASDEWSQTYDLFRCPIPDDDHGVPVLCFDSQGNAHVFGGGHNSAILWWSTSTPRDPSTFVRRGLIGGESSDGYGYPHPVVSGTTIFLFMRDNNGTGMPLVLRKITGVNNGTGTVGGEFTVAQLANTRCYIGWLIRNGNQVIIPVYGSNIADTERRNVWMLVYDLTTGAVSNLAGDSTVAQSSLPVTLGSTHVAVDQIAAGKFGGFGFAERDAAGRLHLIYQQGDTAAGTRTLYHTIYSGGTWSAPVLVGTLGNVYNGSGAKFLSDGTLMLLYSQGPATERDGPMYRRDWTEAGGWSAETLVMPVTGFKLGVPNPVLNGLDDFAMVFSEIVISASGGASLNDTSQGKILKTYAYGTSGLVTAQGVEPSIANAQVNGTPVVGRVLSADADVRGEPQPALAYQWRRAGAAISGATARTYTAVSGDIGASITCSITATSANGSATVIATGQTIQADLTGIGVAQIFAPVLLLHLDATQAGDIALSGSDVSGWTDRSGKGFNLTPAAASTLPNYSATGWDGTRPAVTFDGALGGDMMQADGPLHSYLTVYAVAERIAGLNDNAGSGGLRPMMSLQTAPFDATSHQSQKIMLAVIRPGAETAQTQHTGLAPSGTQATVSGFTVGTKTIIRDRIRPEYGRLVGLRLNSGSEVLSVGMNTGAGESLGNKFFLGGDPTNTGRRAAFKLAEMAIIYGNPTAEQDADIMNRLSDKWGIALP